MSFHLSQDVSTTGKSTMFCPANMSSDLVVKTANTRVSLSLLIKPSAIRVRIDCSV